MMKVQSSELISKRLIGKGLSSIVYETTWKGESYARKDFLEVPSDIFESEAAVLVGLDDHPNVVRAYCWTVDEESCSLVIKLMDDDLLNTIQRRKASQRKRLNLNSDSSPGDASQTISYVIDLDKFIENRKKVAVATSSKSVASPLVQPFDMTEALQIIVQIAEGILFLHSNNVVHGDLKPKNVLVTSRERVVSGSPDLYVKVADFGLVGTKMKSRTLFSCQTLNLEMLRWRAPELLDWKSLNSKSESFSDPDWDSDSSFERINVRNDNLTFAMLERADVYNFAITCSQILTGEDPYLGLGLNELVREVPLGLRPGLPHGCPAQLSDLLGRCWGEDIIGRPNFRGILSELIALQASLRAGPVQLVSGESSGKSGGLLNLVPDSNMNENADAPFGSYENRVITKDFPESLKETKVPSLTPPRSWRRNVFASAGRFGCLKGIPRAKKELKNDPFTNVKSVSSQYPVQWFSFDNIKNMTDNFDERNILGEGGFKKVYKGMEADTREIFAVERAWNQYFFTASTSKGFEVKILMILSLIHHKNLVRLIAYNCFTNAERIFVYEYLPNGSLEDWLHGSKSALPLDLNRRLQIALDATRGLAYLHGTNPGVLIIVHRNVTSRHILLDNNLNAKLAGFAMARLMPDDCDAILETHIDGTPGYVAPECFKTGVISTKADVYSFGVVLLELLTGRHPVGRGEEPRNLVQEVSDRFQKLGMSGVLEWIDPALANTITEELETFASIALIALRCTDGTPQNRPSMHEVEEMLKRLIW